MDKKFLEAYKKARMQRQASDEYQQTVARIRADVTAPQVPQSSAIAQEPIMSSQASSPLPFNPPEQPAHILPQEPLPISDTLPSAFEQLQPHPAQPLVLQEQITPPPVIEEPAIASAPVSEAPVIIPLPPEPQPQIETAAPVPQTASELVPLHEGAAVPPPPQPPQTAPEPTALPEPTPITPAVERPQPVQSFQRQVHVTPRVVAAPQPIPEPEIYAPLTQPLPNPAEPQPKEQLAEEPQDLPTAAPPKATTAYQIPSYLQNAPMQPSITVEDAAVPPIVATPVTPTQPAMPAPPDNRVTYEPVPIAKPTNRQHETTVDRMKGYKFAIIFFTIGFLSICLALFYLWRHPSLLGANVQSAATATPPASAASKDQALANQYIAELAKLVAVPQNETPTVATITDVTKLRQNQPFFDKAQNGDILIIYSEKAYIFDPVRKVIIDSAPVKINNLGNAVPTATNSAAPQTASSSAH